MASTRDRRTMNSQAHQELESWREALGGLALTCASAGESEAGALVLTLHSLIANAPRGSGWALPSRGAIEHWNSVGAELIGALSLVEHQAGYMLSHGPGGEHIATIALAGSGVEASATGSHAAIALVGAIASALSGMSSAHGQWADSARDDGLRLN